MPTPTARVTTAITPTMLRSTPPPCAVGVVRKVSVESVVETEVTVVVPGETMVVTVVAEIEVRVVSEVEVRVVSETMTLVEAVVNVDVVVISPWREAANPKTRLLKRSATQRFPEESKAMPLGPFRPPAVVADTLDVKPVWPITREAD